jgi:hypothetical protein
VINPGLPDFQSGSILKGLAMENVDIFYDIWSHFTAVGYILPKFGMFCCNVVYFVVMWYIFHHFGMLYKENLATMYECMAM